MPLGEPPDDPGTLSDFPEPDPPIGPDRPLLYRIYRGRDPATGRRRGAFFFASAPEGEGGGRYDLEAPHGSCHLARSGIGAWLEVFRTTAIVAADDVRRRRLVITRPPRRIRAADLLAKGARGFGVTGELHTTGAYGVTRAWAARLYEAGFRALHGKVRHDPALRRRSLTLLDAAGEHAPYGWRWEADRRRLDQATDVLDEARASGYRILEVPIDVPTAEPGD